jgi:hypothetical protein
MPGMPPHDEAHAAVPHQVDPNNLAVTLQHLSFAVAAIQKDMGEVKTKVNHIDANLNGSGALDDPGIAGTVRSHKAWKERDEVKIQEHDAWIKAQSAVWRQVLAYANIPLGIALAALWTYITTGHVPPTTGK